MFEKIPTHELEAIKSKLDDEGYYVALDFINIELAKRDEVQLDRDELIEAIRNDITGIYDAMDGTIGSPEHPEDNRWPLGADRASS